MIKDCAECFHELNIEVPAPCPECGTVPQIVVADDEGGWEQFD